MNPHPIRLHVVSASVRPTSAARPLAGWAAGRAREHGRFDVTPVDLAEIDLPFLDEPEYASTGIYAHPHTRAWSALVDSADAFLFVLPMYNGGFTAPFKNAVDFLYREWQGKPAGLLSYSAGGSGGAPAGRMLRPVLEAVGMVPTGASVAVPGITGLVTADGFRAPEGLAGELAVVLDELAALAKTPVSA
ncbi:NAD(P)H-dependent oxidoreductase [Streptomyces sp. NBC_00335]|uniref:NADPH-dependent FMN reductase n=1 Tax=unclassified Streptomyces TaxID=2593676 RepID=UPI0022545501|nr:MULTISPECIES: NAD(P)H-dependent oxidoreductase [unclassified Streptomyces]MCX5407028.1 NAD(P)H-dependent oxidoreductase [Streptomyces sp. NBC_00086]